jgi:hypothetical protein
MLHVPTSEVWACLLVKSVVGEREVQEQSGFILYHVSSSFCKNNSIGFKAMTARQAVTNGIIKISPMFREKRRG